MDFAYVLARVENRVGGPEEPLSDLGEQSFRAFWCRKLLRYVIECGAERFSDVADGFGDIEARPRFSRRGDGDALRIPLADISYETALLPRHIELACTVCSIPVAKEAVVLSRSCYESCKA